MMCLYFNFIEILLILLLTEHLYNYKIITKCMKIHYRAKTKQKC